MASEQKTDVLLTEESKTEHPVFSAIKNSNDEVEKVRNYFEVDGVSIEIEDSAGMTPLMHACWKGFANLAKFLIKQVRKGLCKFCLDVLCANNVCSKLE
jgi:ankyrin repeat protein